MSDVDSAPAPSRRALRLARERELAELGAAASAGETSATAGERGSIAPDDAGTPTPSADAPAASAGVGQRRRERGLLSALVNGLLGALLILILGIAAAAIVVPAMTGSTALTVMTSSMEPALPPGTMVVVRPTQPAEIREGMVMTYQLRSGEPTLVTHRVVERYQLNDGTYEWVTQGDNNPTPDLDRVREVQVRGTVWYAIPTLGWVSAALTGEWRVWAIPAAVLALFGYAGYMVVSAVRDRARGRDTRA